MFVMPKPVLALYNNVTGNMSVIMTTYYLALYENVYTLGVTWNMSVVMTTYYLALYDNVYSLVVTWNMSVMPKPVLADVS